MPLDFGTYRALSGKKNWDAIRADKQMALQYQQMTNKIQEDNLRAQAAARDQIQAAFSEGAKLGLLEPGRERVKEIDLSLRPQIAEKIKQYNGDLDKYMRIEGMNDLQGYLNNLLHHPTTVEELNNYAQKLQSDKDRSEGLISRFETDPVTGEPIDTIDSQLDRYFKGETTRLNYKGAFKPAKAKLDVFGNRYGYSDKYKARDVSALDVANEVYQQAISGGLNERDARQQAIIEAANYERGIKNGGAPIRFKHDNRPQPKAASGGGSTNNNRGLYELLVGAYDGSRPDLIDNEGYWEANAPVKRYNPATKRTTTETRQYLPAFTQLNGRPLGLRSIKEGESIVAKPNLIQNVFVVNRQDKEGNSLGKQFAVITDESMGRYNDKTTSNPFVFYPTPRALFEAISVGSKSESGDATKTDKQLGTLEVDEVEIDNDPLGVL